MMIKAIIIFLLLIAPPVAFAQDQWVFVWVSSSSGKYNVAEGAGEVSIKDGKLGVKAQSTSGVEYSIKGTIKNKIVNASFTVLGSDYFINSPFSGAYAVKHWPKLDNSVGRESITLTDGWNFIGLTHELKK